MEEELNLDSCPYCQASINDSLDEDLDESMVAYECGAVIQINIESGLIDTIRCCEGCIRR